MAPPNGRGAATRIRPPFLVLPSCGAIHRSKHFVWLLPCLSRSSIAESEAGAASDHPSEASAQVRRQPAAHNSQQRMHAFMLGKSHHTVSMPLPSLLLPCPLPPIATRVQKSTKSNACSQNEELANSVLTAPLEDAASAAHDEADDGLGADSLEALRSMSGLSQEGSLDGLSDADADEAAPTSPMVRAEWGMLLLPP